MYLYSNKILIAYSNEILIARYTKSSNWWNRENNTKLKPHLNKIIDQVTVHNSVYLFMLISINESTSQHCSFNLMEKEKQIQKQRLGWHPDPLFCIKAFLSKYFYFLILLYDSLDRTVYNFLVHQRSTQFLPVKL